MIKCMARRAYREYTYTSLVYTGRPGQITGAACSFAQGPRTAAMVWRRRRVWDPIKLQNARSHDILAAFAFIGAT